MPELKSKKTGETFPVSDQAWENYGKQGLQGNFTVTKKDVSPTEVAVGTVAKKAPRTSGETAE